MKPETQVVANESSAAHLEFRHIHHHYGGLAAVQDVSLSLSQGEVLCLLGHSGCGKTTLLRIAAGVVHQQKGQVLIGGTCVADAHDFKPPEQRGVGLMFQDYALFPHLSILDNVLFGLSALPREKGLARARQALEMVQMSHHAQDFPHALSGGEQQRVALARAMAPKPHTLLMDEPFSGLDSRLRDHVRRQTLDMLKHENATAIVVTHDPEEALQVANRIALMRQGQVVQLASPEEIYFSPNCLFAARFFSDLNELHLKVNNNELVTPFGRFAAHGFREGSQVIACIRPHHLKVSKPLGGNRAKIISRIFTGDHDLLEVEVNGLENPIKIRSPQVMRYFPGDEVDICLDRDKMMVFNEENS
ncbi:ABC transporter ATP-binding protein [Polycladidibacter stylochi]|uniref:ABC transporter ATP-binding protein n=1 Tax=Polycladidibacter stylochi TaxID=1807766 RepID=UPI00082E324C|nr:ABC transporter ATP-binding protein [Pseudovibrio stylochi]